MKQKHILNSQDLLKEYQVNLFKLFWYGKGNLKCKQKYLIAN